MSVPPFGLADALQVVYDEGGQVRAMLHSGSRAAGNKTAQHYDRQAAHWLAHHGLSARGGFNHMPTDSEV